MYFYFNDSSTLSEILLVCHAITLNHTSPVGSLVSGNIAYQLSGISGLVLDAIRLTGTGEEMRWWPWREYLAFYLTFRATSMAGRSFAVSWYTSEVRGVVQYITFARVADLQRRTALADVGCCCNVCRIEWFDRGWVCPRTRMTIDRQD